MWYRDRADLLELPRELPRELQLLASPSQAHVVIE